MGHILFRRVAQWTGMNTATAHLYTSPPGILGALGVGHLLQVLLCFSVLLWQLWS